MQISQTSGGLPFASIEINAEECDKYRREFATLWNSLSSKELALNAFGERTEKQEPKKFLRDLLRFISEKLAPLSDTTSTFMRERELVSDILWFA